MLDKIKDKVKIINNPSSIRNISEEVIFICKISKIYAKYNFYSKILMKLKNFL